MWGILWCSGPTKLPWLLGGSVLFLESCYLARLSADSTQILSKIFKSKEVGIIYKWARNIHVQVQMRHLGAFGLGLHKYKQECIPVGCIPPAHWPYLVISYTSPRATMYTPQQPCTPPHLACPPQPCMPPSNHACPPSNHACPPQPCMPPTTTHTPHNHACPPQPRMPPRTMHAPLPLWTEFLTHASENITLPQTSFAGGKYKLLLSVCISANASLLSNILSYYLAMVNWGFQPRATCNLFTASS